ncbi:zinc-ribbon domain-containing protein [Cellulophaga sp. HaHaR_3_176]|uniref:zinc-ribbon domain-containing protein n=1 Tax=Cellulophaga sp. HaHaR_3_176 TaxID=1942464 RepID=UPI001C1FF84A|nr:zinc-ribbon domain-containing protein [Cellulophaga sp. HaHaR_3_176]QWX84189.1 zinc-ribbon domain-containing protein [Cellulophaga sp. HaHaR_3_176]
MILFFGTRQGKTSLKKLDSISCPYCKQLNTLTLIESSNYFHVFWIKLFKLSSHKIAECSHCKRAYYENEFTHEMKQKTIN